MSHESITSLNTGSMAIHRHWSGDFDLTHSVYDISPFDKCYIPFSHRHRSYLSFYGLYDICIGNASTIRSVDASESSLCRPHDRQFDNPILWYNTQYSLAF